MGGYSKHVALSRVFSVAEDIVDEDEALLAYYHDELQEFKENLAFVEKNKDAIVQQLFNIEPTKEEH